ncbi:MAG: carbamate kinase [Candidatus Bathyarchaeota archaeon]|nr:carbamate kinase [Candidatus Bathyarchaeota archaeon]MDH5791160.1 carbamate kinase [Candidatus Bathyarchaeota archaeon]
MSRRLLIALGGNAIKKSDEAGTTQEQFQNVEVTCRQIVRLLQRFGEDDRIAITHGNGPQVGNLLVQQEEASDLVPAQEFDVVGAMSQGQIGYMFQQTLQNSLKRAGGRLAKTPVVALVNQVLVSLEDPEFLDPTKPIGNFFTKEEAEELAKEKGYVIDPPAGQEHADKKRTGFVIKQVKPTGSTPSPFRRVVPSPDPKKNVEGDVIKTLVDQGAIVIASGGGGVPVVANDDGTLDGVFSVIDKDLAGERMAEAIDATDFIILTDVEHVLLDFGKPTQRPMREMSVEDAERYLAEGHFLPGSMGPKVEACVRFLKWGGERAIITSLERLVDAFDAKTGTHIHK